MGSSGASITSRCTCASAAATGVRSSCAELAVKLRSASSALRSRVSRRLTARALGRNSDGSPASEIGDRLVPLRASIPARNRCTGAMAVRTASHTPIRLNGTISSSGSASRSSSSRSVWRRWASGSATEMVIVPCKAASE